MEQILCGVATGFRWFIRLLVTTILLATAGTVLYKFGSKSSGESEDAVKLHHDIRRNIALGVRGPMKIHPSVTSDPVVVPWKVLAPSTGLLGDNSGFESRVEVRQGPDKTDFRVLIGPYDAEVSRSLKSSSGWVTLKLLQSSGLPVPGSEEGLKVELSRFKFHEVGGLPVGWIYSGSFGKRDGSEIAGFELGWVIPSSASKLPSGHIGLR